MFSSNLKFGVKLYPTLLGLSDKISVEPFFLTSVEQYKGEKFDSRWIFCLGCKPLYYSRSLCFVKLSFFSYFSVYRSVKICDCKEKLDVISLGMLFLVVTLCRHLFWWTFKLVLLSPMCISWSKMMWRWRELSTRNLYRKYVWK